jgi:hypothetical protein|tara:strand:+ start:564 stop:680 length:117 start_codon:yes stop_codon:yes gene_type:complete
MVMLMVICGVASSASVLPVPREMSGAKLPGVFASTWRE